MKSFYTVLALAFLAFEASATGPTGCETAGAYCSSLGSTICQCDQGKLLQCQLVMAPAVDGEGGESYGLWSNYKDCPVPSDGGLQCVDGACTS